MPEEAVARILELGPSRAAAELLERKAELEDVEFTSESAQRLGSMEAAQAAWVYRMLFGSNPAREKLTLFWHGHFATSQRKVDDARLMIRQIDLFRDKGAAPFEDLLLEVARDPAMLIWLDGNSNRRGHPNENFARELMELFSLGRGNYTEADIKEAARAFTGWHVRDREFWFNERAHDREGKRVFGREGPLGGEDIVHSCAASDACARFLAAKLFEFYVDPRISRELRLELGKAFRDCGGRTGDFLLKLFSSRIFYSSQARRSLVSTPVDYAVGSLRTLGARASAKALVRALTAMGQELLAPPSVKGWDMGEAWLSSTTLLARYQFAMSLGGEGSVKGLEDLGIRVDWDRLGSHRELLARFFPEGIPAPLADELLSHELLSPGGEGPKAVAAGCLELPEYQFI
jgi:uncharacterized protein (DUF1800 family)